MKTKRQEVKNTLRKAIFNLMPVNLLILVLISVGLGQQQDFLPEEVNLGTSASAFPSFFQIGVANYVEELENPVAKDILVDWHIEGTNDPYGNDWSSIDLTPTGTNKVLAITAKRVTMVENPKLMWNYLYYRSSNQKPNEEIFSFKGYDFMAGQWLIDQIPRNQEYYINIYMDMDKQYKAYRIVVDRIGTVPNSNNRIINPQENRNVVSNVIEAEKLISLPNNADPLAEVKSPDGCIWNAAYGGYVPKNCFSCCGVLCEQYNGPEKVTVCKCPGWEQGGRGECETPCSSSCTPDGKEVSNE